MPPSFLRTTETYANPNLPNLKNTEINFVQIILFKIISHHLDGVEWPWKPCFLITILFEGKFMKLTKEQIKIIEKTADELKVLADNLSYSPPCATIIQFPPSWCYNKEKLLLLEKTNTNIGDKVERDFAEADKLQQEYESWRDKDITEDNEEEFTLLIDSLKGALYELSDNLHQIAEYANEELITHKPAEKEQNTPSAKFLGIKAFIWKLYEKTLKVIVDAVLEKLWPW